MSTKNVLFEQHNSGLTNVNMQYTKVFSNVLVDPKRDTQDSYTLSRINIPTSKLRRLKTDSSHTVGLKMKNWKSNAYEVKQVTLPSFPLYNSSEMIIEYINRAYFQCYRNCLTEISGDADINVFDTDTQTISAGGNVTTLSSTHALTSSYSKVTGVKVTLSSFTANTLDLTKCFTVDVESPSGEKTVLYTGLAADFFNALTRFGTLEVCEDSFYKLTDELFYRYSSGECSSMGSIVDFLGATRTGNWKVNFTSATAFDIDVDVKLDVWFANDDNVPSLPPFLSRSADKLVMKYLNWYQLTGSMFGTGAGFSSVLVFNSNELIRDTTNSLFYLNLESLGDVKSDLQSKSQEYSTLSLLSNVVNVRVTSNKLGSQDMIVNDVSSVLSSNVIYDFSVLKDGSFASELEFSQTNIPLKRAKLIGPIQDIDFTIVLVYSNGEEEIAQLGSGERLQVRLSFF